MPQVFSRMRRNMSVRYDKSTSDSARFVRANSPFYQSHLKVGSEFGSATKAYFVFFSSMLSINLVLFLLWLPVWIPQVPLTHQPQPCPSPT